MLLIHGQNLAVQIESVIDGMSQLAARMQAASFSTGESALKSCPLRGSVVRAPGISMRRSESAAKIRIFDTARHVSRSRQT